MVITFSLLGFILGTILGSLLKVLADRSLSEKSFFGRSFCTYCKKKLRWYDLIPLFSYLFLKGRCRYCHKKISKEYVLVELVSGILVGYLFYQTYPLFLSSLFNFQPPISNFQFLILIFNLFIKTFFIIILLSLFLTDFKKMLIPDRIILPATVISIISLVFLTIIKISYLYLYLSHHPIGKYLLPPHSKYFQSLAFSHIESFFTNLLSGFVLAAFFLLLIIVTRGKGMGGGDVKLGIFMGINLGVINTLIGVMLSFLIGAVFSIILIILGKRKFGSVIPFGPFLVIGSLIALFWGSQIVEWYLKLGP